MADNVQTLPTPVLLGKGLAVERSDAIFEVGGRPFWLVPAVRDCDLERYARNGMAVFYRLKVYALARDLTTASGYRVGDVLWSGPEEGRLTALASQVIAFRRNPASWIKGFTGLRRRLAELSPEPVPQAPAPAPIAPTDWSDPSAVRALRQRLGLTQQRLAERLGVSMGAVAHWETARSRPGPEPCAKLEQLAAAAAKAG